MQGAGEPLLPAHELSFPSWWFSSSDGGDRKHWGCCSSLGSWQSLSPHSGLMAPRWQEEVGAQSLSCPSLASLCGYCCGRVGSARDP